jgi:hypothetical protein
VPPQDALPRVVPEHLHQVRRALDVGEHERLLDPARRLLPRSCHGGSSRPPRRRSPGG